MKTYFNFTLQPRQMLNLWLVFYVLVLIPYVLFMVRYSGADPTAADTSGLLLLGVLAVILMGMALYFYFTRLFLEHVEVGERKVEFTGDFATYSSKAIPGFLLSIFTLGIYLAWFMRDLARFFGNSTSVDGASFRFGGRPERLLVIMLITLFMPLMVVALVSVNLPLELLESTWFRLIDQAVTMVILIPYMYYVYAWLVDFQYKEYHIYWDTRFGEAAPLILREVLLTIITLGIYFPLMYLKLYEFFASRTVVAREGKAHTLGYELEAGEDFGYVWMQLLLCILTAGIYVPWAISLIGKRVLGKTYLREIDLETGN